MKERRNMCCHQKQRSILIENVHKFRRHLYSIIGLSSPRALFEVNKTIPLWMMPQGLDLHPHPSTCLQWSCNLTHKQANNFLGLPFKLLHLFFSFEESVQPLPCANSVLKPDTSNAWLCVIWGIRNSSEISLALLQFISFSPINKN